jgi:hypothetical protein
MGLREKYQENSLEIKKLLEVPSDEPIFIFRAQDKFSVETLRTYKSIAHNRTIIGEESETWVDDLGSIINDFINWQRDHPDKIKVPD